MVAITYGVTTEGQCEEGLGYQPKITIHGGDGERMIIGDARYPRDRGDCYHTKGFVPPFGMDLLWWGDWTSL
jgi:hypothetical protein